MSLHTGWGQAAHSAAPTPFLKHKALLLKGPTVPNLNKVMLMGNLTRDIELSFLPSQTAVAKGGLAINREWTKDGEKKSEVTFVDLTCFGKGGEILAKYVKKGDPLYIDGRLHLSQWEAKDGTKRSKLEVIVENFQFLGGKRDGNQDDAAHAPQRTRNAPPPADEGDVTPPSQMDDQSIPF